MKTKQPQLTDAEILRHAAEIVSSTPLKNSLRTSLWLREAANFWDGTTGHLHSPEMLPKKPIAIIGSISIELRKHADSFNDNGPHDNPGSSPDTYRRAADEIDRLTRLLWHSLDDNKQDGG